MHLLKEKNILSRSIRKNYNKLGTYIFPIMGDFLQTWKHLDIEQVLLTL